MRALFIRTQTQRDTAGVDTLAEGVTILLYEVVSGTVGATPVMTTTTISGTYQFTGLTAGDYKVVIPFEEFSSTGSLYDGVTGTPYATSPGNATGVGDDDANHNGATNGGLGIASEVITLGDTEPTGEAAHGMSHAGDDANDDWSVDFAFYLPDPTSVGLLSDGANTMVLTTVAATTTALLLGVSYVVIRRRRSAIE